MNSIAVIALTLGALMYLAYRWLSLLLLTPAPGVQSRHFVDRLGLVAHMGCEGIHLLNLALPFPRDG